MRAAQGHRLALGCYCLTASTSIIKYNVDELTKQIAAKGNERFKTELVKDVLVEQLNYLAKSEVRFNSMVEKTDTK